MQDLADRYYLQYRTAGDAKVRLLPTRTGRHHTSRLQTRSGRIHPPNAMGRPLFRGPGTQIQVSAYRCDEAMARGNQLWKLTQKRDFVPVQCKHGKQRYWDCPAIRASARLSPCGMLHSRWIPILYRITTALCSTNKPRDNQTDCKD